MAKLKLALTALLALFCLGWLSAARADWSEVSRLPPQVDAMVGGRDDGGQALYLCRASYRGSLQVGKARDGIGGCHFGYGGREIVVPAYQYWVNAWLPNASGADPVSFGYVLVQGRQIVRSPCLGFYEPVYPKGVRGRVLTLWIPGQYGPDLGRCSFAYGGVEHLGAAFRILSNPLRNDGSQGAGGFNSVGWFVIKAVAENGAPPFDTVGSRDGFSVCSAGHVDGVHPGWTRPGAGGCHLTYAGKEYVEPNYEILIPDWTAESGSDFSCGRGRVVGGVCQARTRPIAAGTDTNGASLYFCRVRAGSGVHPGRIGKAFRGCSIGYGGKEVVAVEYDLLTDGFDGPPQSH